MKKMVKSKFFSEKARAGLMSCCPELALHSGFPAACHSEAPARSLPLTSGVYPISIVW